MCVWRESLAAILDSNFPHGYSDVYHDRRVLKGCRSVIKCIAPANLIGNYNSVDVPSSRIQVSSYLSTRLHLHGCSLLRCTTIRVCACVWRTVSDLWPFKLVNSAVNERASITFDSKLTWIVKRSNGLPQMSFNACGHIDDFRQLLGSVESFS